MPACLSVLKTVMTVTNRVVGVRAPPPPPISPNLLWPSWTQGTGLKPRQ